MPTTTSSVIPIRMDCLIWFCELFAINFDSCELIVSQVEPLFDSVIRTYYKLDELGIKEVDGQIVFIDNMEVSHE